MKTATQHLLCLLAPVRMAASRGLILRMLLLAYFVGVMPLGTPARAQAGATRTWTDTKGRTLSGVFVEANTQEVIVRRADGELLHLSRMVLSPDDLDYANKVQAANAEWQQIEARERQLSADRLAHLSVIYQSQLAALGPTLGDWPGPVYRLPGIRADAPFSATRPEWDAYNAQKAEEDKRDAAAWKQEQRKQQQAASELYANYQIAVDAEQRATNQRIADLRSNYDREQAARAEAVRVQAQTTRAEAARAQAARAQEAQQRATSDLTFQNKAAANTPQATGTGTIITAQGHVLTAAHVVKGATVIKVVTSLGTKSATVLRVDEANDIAILKISDGVFTPIAVTSSRQVKLGQAVATIGFPNVEIQGFSPKLTKGEISSINGIGDDPRSWQISVPVQPGNSGGPLLDENGNLVGVVVSKLGIKAAEATGDIPQNVNYAVKSAYALGLLDPYLGDKPPAPNEPDPKRKFEDMVAKAQQSVVLILVY